MQGGPDDLASCQTETFDWKTLSYVISCQPVATKSLRPVTGSSSASSSKEEQREASEAFPALMCASNS